MIDIVNIKSAVNNEQIEFSIKDDGIYCLDKQSGEIIKVAENNEYFKLTHEEINCLQELEQSKSWNLFIQRRNENEKDFRIRNKISTKGMYGY